MNLGMLLQEERMWHKVSYRYKLYQDNSRKEMVRYTMDELQGMGTFMLRDICVRERIMTQSAGTQPKRLGRPELIRLLFRYRGKHEEALKDAFLEESAALLGMLIKKASIAAEKLELPYKIEIKKDIPLLKEEGVRISHGFEGEYFLGALKDSEGNLLALFELHGDRLSLSPWRVSEALRPGQYRDLEFVLFDGPSSRGAVQAYNGQACLPSVERNMTAATARLPILSVVEAGESADPLFIDFGTVNTVAMAHRAGEILKVGFGKNCLCKSVGAVESCKGDQASFCYGQEAYDLVRRDGYENAISFFHNLKLYLYEERELDICDGEGNGATISSDRLLGGFFRYVIARAKGAHGRNYKTLAFLLPEKRGSLALSRLREILPEYQVESARSESFNSIYERIAKLLEPEGQNDLAFDGARELAFRCGGGSVSLTACSYEVENTQVSYKVRLREQYLSGDSGFGGNFLTYLIFTYLKIRSAEDYLGTEEDLLDERFSDSYSYVDQHGGTDGLYDGIRRRYEEAELTVPTRFAGFDEHRLLKRQNFFRLWLLAEQVKTAFFGSTPLNVIELPGRFESFSAVNVFGEKGVEEHRLTFPVHRAEIEGLIAPEIYRVVKKMIAPLCDESGILSGYRIRFTGLSLCIPGFRDALREFTVGRRARTGQGEPYDLKLRALRGAILREQMEKSGRLVPEITREEEFSPCMVAAGNHEGSMVLLMPGGQSGLAVTGYISRHMATREVEFLIWDLFEHPLGSRFVSLDIEEFEDMGYDGLFESYPAFMKVQGDLDSIGEEEIRLFVFREENWDFSVLPVARREGVLSVDRVRRFLFEEEGVDYFCGDK